MAASSRLCSIILALVLSLFVEATMERKLTSVTTKEEEEDSHFPISLNKVKDNESDDPSLYMYFAIDDLETTKKKLPLYFSKDDLRNVPPLLSREESESIPFSKRNLSFLLDHFSIPEDSPQGRAVKETLGHCGSKAMEGEVKFCATSLESMLDLVRETLGFGVRLRVMTTRVVDMSENVSYTLQNYTFAETPEELVGVKMLGCHRMPYPYVVYYCHGHRDGTKVFKVNLVAYHGRQRVVGPAVCHMDTSTWDEGHVVFRVLKMKPRSAPVCHFFPLDNIVWTSM